MSQSTLPRTDPPFETEQPHSLEHAVRNVLMQHPEFGFSSLTVHRIQNGVCLEGVVDVGPDAPDLRDIVASVLDVETVVNRLVVRTNPTTPR